MDFSADSIKNLRGRLRGLEHDLLVGETQRRVAEGMRVDIANPVGFEVLPVAVESPPVEFDDEPVSDQDVDNSNAGYRHLNVEVDVEASQE